jgi:hypothetical protein
MNIDYIKDNSTHIAKGIKDKIERENFLIKYKSELENAIYSKNSDFLIKEYCMKSEMLSLYYYYRVTDKAIEVLHKDHKHPDFKKCSFNELYRIAGNIDVQIVKVINGIIVYCNHSVLWARLEDKLQSLR